MTMPGKLQSLAASLGAIEGVVKHMYNLTSDSASKDNDWRSRILARVEAIEAQCRCIRDTLNQPVTEEQP